MNDEPVAPDLDQQLNQIQAISQNARTTWFGLIALTLFVGVTLMAHEDADFFARDAATRLPILNIDVPVIAFFFVAPLLVTAIHTYLHLYLVTLWQALARVPARDGDGDTPIADRVFPWLMAHAALRLRARLRGDGAAGPRAMGWLVNAVSAALGWLAPVFVLAWLWVQSMPLHNEWLTGWIAICLLFATFIGWAGDMALRSRMRDRAQKRRTIIWSFVFAALIFLVGYATLEHTWVINKWRFPNLPETTRKALPDWLPRRDRVVARLPGRARLTETRLTPRPKDWRPFDFWLSDQRRANVGGDDRWGDPEQDPMIPNANEKARWRLLIATLDAPVLTTSDLRDANATGTFMAGADLRGADLSRAKLIRARMEGARLGKAWLEGADLSGARLEGADLSRARMRGANLSWARLDGADLAGAQMPFANFNGAHMRGTNLSQADLDGADLSQARLEGADLSRARLEGADLSQARLAGANLVGARMPFANFRGVRLEGAYLMGAQIGAASDWSDCTGAEFVGALVHSSHLACRNLDLSQLQYVVGDEFTRLPPGMHVWSCLDRNMLPQEIGARIDTVLSKYPEEGTDLHPSRAQFEAMLFCDPSSDDSARRRPEVVGSALPGWPY